MSRTKCLHFVEQLFKNILYPEGTQIHGAFCHSKLLSFLFETWNKDYRDFFQEFACNGTVVDHPEYGEVIQLQGDQRNSIKSFLLKMKLAKEDQLKVLFIYWKTRKRISVVKLSYFSSC